MIYLTFASLLWAFSFGLIKNYLSSLDPAAVACLRLAISLLVFLPFMRLRRIDPRLAFHLIGIGAIQYGIMYVAYIYAFQFLKAYEVALFTIFTPFYVIGVSVFNALRVNLRLVLSAFLASAGAGVIVYAAPHAGNILWGFILVQLSNLAFAFGQVRYKIILNRSPIKEIESFALLYLGGTLVAGAALTLIQSGKSLWPTPRQWLVLMFLGIAASALAFFLWNLGAVRSPIGILAVFNNVKVPLAVLAAVIIFHEKTVWPRLICGGGLLISALFIVTCRKD